MTGNRYLVTDKTVLLKSRLDSLTSKLQSSIASGELVTQEQYIQEVSRILGELQSILTLPEFNLEDIQPETYPDPDVYNELWKYLLDTLIAVFQEFENIEALAVSNFNYTMVDADRLITKMKGVASLLGDYILYAVDTTKNAGYFGDSFNDLSKIDTYSTLLTADQCEIHQGEGIVTLPISNAKDSVIAVSTLPTINSVSNGTRGNNQESGALWRGNLIDILDNNADTWFEYENVVSRQDPSDEPLILDITLDLGEEKVVNHIRINSNNFGTKTALKIDAIDTSVDGASFVSIKDEIPIPGFVVTDEPNVFVLSPSASKYAGEGLYTFPPRKVRYIHLAFRQDEAYIITTASGDRYRYGIGIRDIQVKGIVFSSQGEIISQPFETTDEIRKVLLRTRQVPVLQSELGSIDFAVSPDNGVSWHPIIPDNFNDLGYLAEETSVPEVTDTVSIRELVDFNGIGDESISTLTPVQDLRLRATFKRDDAAFDEPQVMVVKQIANLAEPLSIPTSAPASVTLTKRPIDKKVKIAETGFGSCGEVSGPYSVGFNAYTSGQQEYRLPLFLSRRPWQKRDGGFNWITEPFSLDSWISLKVNGELWSQATGPISGLSATDKMYSLNVSNWKLSFGDGTNGAQIPDGAKIDLIFTPDRLAVQADGLATLLFPTSNNQNVCELRACLAEQVGQTFLNRGTVVIDFPDTYITDYTNLASFLDYQGYNEVSYINGQDELDDSVDWSIDTERGILYLGQPVSRIEDYPITYSYTPSRLLSNTEWEWVNDSSIESKIRIKSGSLETIQVSETLLLDDANYMVDLANLSILPGSMKFFTGGVAELDNPFLKEVQFIDGRQEFNSDIVNKTESIPALTSGLNTFVVSESMYSDLSWHVFFSNTTIFSTRKGLVSEVDAFGEYHIDRATKTVTVFCTASYELGQAGEITYPNENEGYQTYGLYSIDNPTGRIFTDRSINPSWNIRCTYNYSHYEMSYPIVRTLSPNAFSFDPKTNAITFNDTEAFLGAVNTLRHPDGRARQYIALYSTPADKEVDITGLKDYFSPILYDYVLKILTKGNLF